MVKITKIALAITLILILMLVSALITWDFASQALQPIRLGDVNNDRKINEVDIKLIQEHLLEIRALSDDEKARADMNQDGDISVLDMLSIQRHILGVD